MKKSSKERESVKKVFFFDVKKFWGVESYNGEENELRNRSISIFREAANKETKKQTIKQTNSCYHFIFSGWSTILTARNQLHKQKFSLKKD